MNEFAHMIVFFDDNIVNNVAIRLGDCQQYSDKITQQVLSKNGVDINSPLRLDEILKLLRQRKNLKVSFYCLKEEENLYIFSVFFNLEGGFSDSRSFFDDINSAFLMCENTGEVICGTLMKCGKIVSQFKINTSDLQSNLSNAWQQDYNEIFDNSDGLPRISQIVDSLNYMVYNSSKSNIQMHKYLKKHALFIDQYIL